MISIVPAMEGQDPACPTDVRGACQDRARRQLGAIERSSPGSDAKKHSSVSIAPQIGFAQGHGQPVVSPGRVRGPRARRFAEPLRFVTLAAPVFRRGFDKRRGSRFDFGMDKAARLLENSSRPVRWLLDDIEATIRDPERALATPVGEITKALNDFGYLSSVARALRETEDEGLRQAFKWCLRGLGLQLLEQADADNRWAAKIDTIIKGITVLLIALGISVPTLSAFKLDNAYTWAGYAIFGMVMVISAINLVAYNFLRKRAVAGRASWRRISRLVDQ